MCARCRAEYEDPADRRFHAQPNACPACGPSVSLLDACGARGAVAGRRRSRASGAGAARAAAIVAVKGIGGFHLACRADDEQAVAALRARKHREDKPFALMAPSLAAAAWLARPRRRRARAAARARSARSCSRPRLAGRAGRRRRSRPGAPELGVMLPYSPLHHLLLADVGATLVMTSGNVSDEPIAYGDEDALERLGGIADLLLVHDRPIQTRTDDSVVRSRRARTGPHAFLRRSRGYVPAALPLPGGGTPRPLLACGAELKNTFCLAEGGRAWVSHHIGDLENYETLRSFTEGIEHFERCSRSSPRSSPTTCTPSTCRPSTRSSATASS